MLPVLFLLLTIIALVALVSGMVKPNLVIRWGEDEKKSRKRVFAIYGTAIVVLLFALGSSVPELTPEQKAERAEILLAEAIEEMDNENYEDAKSKLEDALWHVPEYAEALELLAGVEERIADEEARLIAKEEEEAKEEAKQEARELIEQAKQLKAEHKYDEAKEVLEKSVEIYSGETEEVEQLISSIIQQKEAYEKEQSEIANAEAEKESREQALDLVKEAEGYIDQHEYDRAEGKLNEALALSPELEEATYWLPQIEVMKIALEKEKKSREQAAETTEQAAETSDNSNNEIVNNNDSDDYYVRVDEPVYTNLGLTLYNLTAEKSSFFGFNESIVVRFSVTNEGQYPFELTNGTFMLQKAGGNSIWPVDGTIFADGGNYISLPLLPGDTVVVEQYYDISDETLANYELLLPLNNGEIIALYYFY